MRAVWFWIAPSDLSCEINVCDFRLFEVRLGLRLSFVALAVVASCSRKRKRIELCKEVAGDQQESYNARKSHTESQRKLSWASCSLGGYGLLMLGLLPVISR